MNTKLNPASSSEKSFKRKLIIPLLSAIYLILAYITTGIRNDHLLLVTIVNASFFISDLTRRFITGFSIFVIYWILFDSMKLWPNWSFAEVDILPIYNLEKNWFGIMHEGVLLTPNEYFNLHQTTFLDILSSSFYLCWALVPADGILFVICTKLQHFIYKLGFGSGVTSIGVQHCSKPNRYMPYKCNQRSS